MKKKKKKKNIKLLKNKKRAARRSRRIKKNLFKKTKSRKNNLNKSSLNHSYKFVLNDGTNINGTRIVFPIINRRNDGRFEFVATGFFINSYGGFITAKHVVLDNDGGLLSSLYGVHVISDSEYIIRRIESIEINSNADAAAGMLEAIYNSDGELISNNVLAMSKARPQIGESIKTFAYPLSRMYEEDENTDIGEFSADWFMGEIVEHLPNGRDRTFLPTECYQTSALILGGASGGPVINSEGVVIGINSTGFDFGDPNYGNSVSFITPIQKAFEISVQTGSNEYMTIEEIANIDSVVIE